MAAAWGLAASALIGAFAGGGSKKKATTLTPYQSAMQEAAAYRDTAPTILSTDQQHLPEFARLDNQIALNSADTLAAGNLDLQRKYAPGYADLQLQLGRQIDPNGAATYDELGKQVLANLRMGNTLNDQERQQVQQNTMAAQSARGNLWGSAAAYEDALNTGHAATARGLQRQNQAMAFLTGADPILGEGIPLNYSAPDSGGTSYAQLRGFGADQASLQQQAAMSNANATNPWLQAIGQVGGTYLGAKIAKSA